MGLTIRLTNEIGANRLVTNRNPPPIVKAFFTRLTVSQRLSDTSRQAVLYSGTRMFSHLIPCNTKGETFQDGHRAGRNGLQIFSIPAWTKACEGYELGVAK